jgi:predicted RNA-binding protein with PIN domain
MLEESCGRFHLSTMSNPRVLLVDGHNILHAWSDFRERLGRNPNAAQDELIHRLNLYRDASETHVVLVFDGRRRTPSKNREPKSIQVIFSASGQSADAVLEQLARAYSERFDLLVASDDLALQDAVVAAGATPISAEALRRQMEAVERGFRSRWDL